MVRPDRRVLAFAATPTDALRSGAAGPLAQALAALGLLALAAACEPLVLIGGSAPPRPELRRQPNGPIDLLFVVDNSGSMLEEQGALSRSIFREDCPILDLNAVPAALLNPEAGLLEELASVCGISQILAAYDRDFRVGVITTDINACDNLTEFESPEHRPQRGCLQPVPSTREKVISRSDSDLIRKFRELVAGLGNRGSPAERGLDAVDLFLRADDVTEGCEGDRDQLLRPEAELLLVFVSDEDDCSHDETMEALPDHSEVCAQDLDWFRRNHPDRCYGSANLLTDVGVYAERFRAFKGEGRADFVRAMVVGGAVARSGAFVARGCRAEDDAISEGCWESGGLSNFTGPVDICGEETAAEREFQPCCTADAARRYFELAELMNGQGASICAADYVADLVRFLDLTEDDG